MQSCSIEMHAYGIYDGIQPGYSGMTNDIPNGRQFCSMGMRALGIYDGILPVLCRMASDIPKGRNLYRGNVMPSASMMESRQAILE